LLLRFSSGHFLCLQARPTELRTSMENLSWRRWLCEDFIGPMRDVAPMTVAASIALLIMGPFIFVGDYYLLSLWFQKSQMPPILMPMIILLSLFALLLSIGVAFVLWLSVIVSIRVAQHSKELRLRRAAEPRGARSPRLWAALAVSLRLANMRAAGAGAGKQWKDAWQSVASARAGRRRRLANEELDLNGWTQRLSSPLIALTMWVFIAFGQHAFYTIALPWFSLGKYLKMAVLPSTAVVAVRMFVDYARVLFMDPGRPAKDELTELSMFSEGGEYGPEEGKKPRWCARCNAPKPFRTHHCSICRRCVLKMDHHCVFVSNCVGLRNYRYFCLLLLEVAFGSCVLAICLLPQLPAVLGIVKSRGRAGLNWKYRVQVLVAFVVAAFGTGLIGPFFRSHLRMVLRGETTLEKMVRDDKKAEEKKKRKATNGHISDPVPEVACASGNGRSPMENFCEVFGSPPAWARRYVEALVGWLASRKTVKRSD